MTNCISMLRLITEIKYRKRGFPMHMIDRNSPCWCGSGLKYKKCHYDFDEKLLKDSFCTAGLSSFS